MDTNRIGRLDSIFSGMSGLVFDQHGTNKTHKNKEKTRSKTVKKNCWSGSLLNGLEPAK